MYNKSLLKSVISCFLLFNIAYLARCQETTSPYIDKTEDEYIRWVSQYPSLTKDKRKVSFTDRITQLLFGQKDPRIIKPVSIIAINPDSVWILDQGNGTILEVNNKVGEIPRFFRENIGYYNSLIGMCIINESKILFTDSHLNKIFLLSGNEKNIQIYNDSLELKQPTGIAFSRISKEIWVVETAAHRISILDEDGNLIRRIGKRGNAPGEFNYPTFIWIDVLGTIYVVDSMNFRIQMFDLMGNFISAFGKIGDATGYFARPKGIATDSYGNIYVADGLFHTVQIFNKHGEFLYNFGNQGRGKGEFWMPAGLYIDDKNYIYVADSYNSRMQVFQLIKEN